MMTFNGVDLSEYIEITNVTGRGVMAQEVISSSVAGMDGSYYLRRRLPKRSLGVEFDLYEGSREELRSQVDELSGVFNVDRPVPIVFSDEPEMTYYGMLDGQPDWEEFVSSGSGVLPIVCHDPYKYGPEQVVTGDMEMEVINNGMADVYPFITAEIKQQEIPYFYVSGFSYIFLAREFVVGDQIVINSRRGEIRLNGERDLSFLGLDVDFLPLRRGVNNINVPVGYADVVITWREVWL